MSWGYLGKPPEWVINSIDPLITKRYKWYAEQAAKLTKMGKRGAVQLAELKVNFTREFPNER